MIDFSQGITSPADVKAVQERVHTYDVTLAPNMEATKAASRAVNEIEKTLSSTKNIDMMACDTALKAILDHIVKVEDGSYLTLDPDLDTYYLQNVTTVRMPSLTVSAAHVLAAAFKMFKNFRSIGKYHG